MNPVDEDPGCLELVEGIHSEQNILLQADAKGQGHDLARTGGTLFDAGAPAAMSL